MAGRGDERRDDTRRELMHVAKELIADRGLDALTVQAVTSSAGMSLGSFYNYFQSKDELIDETIAAYTAESDDIKARVAAGEIDPLRAMELLVERAVELMRSDPTRAAFMHEIITGSLFEDRMISDMELFVRVKLPGDALVQRNVSFMATLLKGAVASAYEYAKDNPEELQREDAFADAYAILLRILGLHESVNSH